MKKLVLMLVAIAVYSTSSAKIWRINNIPGVSADFTTVQAAHNSLMVLVGDTLHLEPSITNYGDLTMTKRLTIISIGDFLPANPGVEYSVITGTMTSLSISNVSASGSVFHCNFNSNVSVSNANNLRFERCHIEGFLDFSTSNNNTVLQSYLSTVFLTGSGSIVISNNIIGYYMNVSATSSATISNNVIFAENYITGQQIQNCTFQNNILNQPGNFTFTNCIVENNLGSDASGLPTGNGNQNAVEMTNVFVAPSGKNDAAFKLQTTVSNPAKGAGIGGIDCGAYGGTSPLKPGLQAAIPAIYKLNAPVTPSGSTMNITFSTRSNN